MDITPASGNLYEQDPTGLGGDIAPTGFWDPAGLAQGKDADTLRMYREAELKHGRVCMLASAGLLTQEILTNPLGIDGPAINHPELVSTYFPEFFALFVTFCAFVEAYSVDRFYETGKGARGLPGKDGLRLKAEANPGDLQWDPLGWYPEDPAEQQIIKTKELQNGRLAMLGTAGIVVQEMMDNKEILCHFQKVCA
jgi:light-harvesting complex I chlorophyll a/b binding protein 1